MTTAGDLHVSPTWQEHRTDSACWCAPKMKYEDPLGGRLWVHRAAVDMPHDYDPCVVIEKAKAGVMTVVDLA